MKVISISSQSAKTVENALEVIDSLREAVANGQIKAFAAVGIEPDNSTKMWCSATRPTTKLEMIGAMHHMLHNYEVDG